MELGAKELNPPETGNSRIRLWIEVPAVGVCWLPLEDIELSPLVEVSFIVRGYPPHSVDSLKIAVVHSVSFLAGSTET